jgi:penicillin amidase
MRIVPFLLSLFLTTGLIVCLNRQWGGLQKTPVLGSFLSPQHGFWQNAEPVGTDFSGSVTLPGLKDKGEVYFDEYLVPHVNANSEADACYIQGYLHAKFRLWQMEFQTFAAAGRLSEVLGAGKDNSYLTYDRAMRRLGMVTAAQASLDLMEKDSTSKKDCDAYTAGVNAWISQLKESDLPLEYKLLNYRPEPWTNLKIALFVKYMAYDLAGGDNDFEMTNAKTSSAKKTLRNSIRPSRTAWTPLFPKESVSCRPF